MPVEVVVYLEILAGFVITITVLCTGFYKLYKPLKAQFDRIKKLETWTHKQQIDIENARERNMLMHISILTCLERISKEGHNGEVAALVQEIRKLLVTQSHQGISYKADN